MGEFNANWVKEYKKALASEDSVPPMAGAPASQQHIFFVPGHAKGVLTEVEIGPDEMPTMQYDGEKRDNMTNIHAAAGFEAAPKELSLSDVEAYEDAKELHAVLGAMPPEWVGHAAKVAEQIALGRVPKTYRHQAYFQTAVREGIAIALGLEPLPEQEGEQ